ncbi:MAG: peptide ABC transporter substrate-binding protein [Candidatus Dojkabacteria bacterium]|nr:peptide ABC transporter substrate-binding protein [Candidatus Dojkabacteria bacterium]
MIIPHKENIFTNVRENMWNYPSYLFAREGFFSAMYTMYRLFRPFSHILLLFIIFLFLGLANYTESFQLIGYQDRVIVEGIITGDSTIAKINPLLPTNKQIETDLARMIYLPLVRVNQVGEPKGLLALSWEQVDEDGKEYKFSLREDVYWHDGEKFTADDVIATFEVLKALGGENGIESKSAELATTCEVVKLDNYTIMFKLEKIVPTFFEDIDVGILPKHVLDDVSLSTFSWSSFNLKPIGTGPFILESLKENVITLTAHSDSFLGVPYVEKIEIVMFENGDAAVEALKSGEIHILADPSTAILDELEGWPNLDLVKSATLHRRYFALYFNLKNGGSDVLSDLSVRQAISYGINKQKIVDRIKTAGEKANGPIPVTSWAYNSDINYPDHDVEKAKKILEKGGWEEKEIEGRQVRIKDDKILRFELSFLDKFERNIVADEIKKDLEQIGIIVNLDPRNTSDLNEALVATRNFEAVLYGVETPVDPDRIRLWHSEAVDYPGLNISSYVSEQQGAIISDQKLQRVSVIDVALENGRSSLDKNTRIGSTGLDIGYAKFQEVLIDDTPAVFLYHPVYTYVVHKRVKGVDLYDITAPEDRYLYVVNWRIE